MSVRFISSLFWQILPWKRKLFPVGAVCILTAVFLWSAYEIDGRADGFTDEELCRMAEDYYIQTSGKKDGPGYVEIDSEAADGQVLIWLYDVVEDGAEGAHGVTRAWYQIDRKTGRGVDAVTLEEVDLTAAAGSAGSTLR